MDEIPDFLFLGGGLKKYYSRVSFLQFTILFRGKQRKGPGVAGKMNALVVLISCFIFPEALTPSF